MLLNAHGSFIDSVLCGNTPFVTDDFNRLCSVSFF